MTPDTPGQRATPDDVVAFWQAAGPARWFAKDAAFDADFTARFNAAHNAAAAGRLARWADTATGALALVILLDQFPRNAFRGTARMFATDAQALALADAAVAQGFDLQVADPLRPFFYLPFMHSEALADQARCLALCAPLGESTRSFAREHHDIVARFGRFPHRNAVLGRASTPEEQQFLDDGGFAG